MTFIPDYFVVLLFCNSLKNVKVFCIEVITLLSIVFMVINGIFCGSISKFANASLQEASKIAYVTCHARLTYTSITFIRYLREFYSVLY